MKRLALIPWLLGLLIGLFLPSLQAAQTNDRTTRLPYLKAGLDERQAAAYLLDRFTFGARPGDVDRVVAVGLDRWVQQQLQGGLPERELGAKLAAFPALKMTDQQMTSRYPGGLLLSAHARRFYDLIPPNGSPVDFDWVRSKVDKFRQAQGILEDKHLQDELIGQKVMRAVYSENQLTEVLANFWVNHFYATPTNFRSRPWILSYERNVIRPNALGKFSDLLAAAAKHPALLQYLENAQSALPTDETSLMAFNVEKMRAKGDRDKAAVEQTIALAEKDLQNVEAEENMILDKKFRPREGIKQDYARALIELHTLGPNGGQTPQDIADAARAFSGWTSMPIGVTAEWFKGGFADAQKIGFVRKGSFLFRADWHDAKEKQIFGKTFAAGGGIEEGEQILEYLAANPATARHITRKLAERFVSEKPSDALLEQLSASFSKSNGDLKAVMQTLVESPEFWNASLARSKVKSPFELAVSALRSVKAEVTTTKGLTDWIAKMGEPLYAYQAAQTGYPDRGDYWINAGALAQRMNFAVNLGAGRIDGVTINPLVVVSNRKTESVEKSLALYADKMLPGRDVAQTVNLLQPIVRDARFFDDTVTTGALVADNTSVASSGSMTMSEQGDNAAMNLATAKKKAERKSDPRTRVIGMIVGSPQFQLH